ncbi:hypothetical protein TRVA0_003S03136 [Trichomonascus vanleenenianus]|uniref:Mnd2p n=1 Tax=Trichomonascus vanleenenianus TaxID=2268995 RepID=UPI003EC9C37D
MFVALDTREKGSLWGKPSSGHVLRPPKRSAYQGRSGDAAGGGANENVAAAHRRDPLGGAGQEPRGNVGLVFGAPLAVTDLNDVEYIEQLHEARLEAIRTFGYTYLRPPGVDKTMQAMLEEQDMCEEAMDQDQDQDFVDDSALAANASVQTDTFAGRRTTPHEPLGSEPQFLYDPSSDNIALEIQTDDEEEEEEEEEEEREREREVDLDAEVPEASDNDYDDDYDEAEYQEGFMVDEDCSESEENQENEQNDEWAVGSRSSVAQETMTAENDDEDDDEPLDYTVDESNGVQAVKNIMFGKPAGPPSGTVLDGLGEEYGFKGSSAQASEAEDGDAPGEMQLTYGSTGVSSSPPDSDDGEADMSF